MGLVDVHSDAHCPGDGYQPVPRGESPAEVTDMRSQSYYVAVLGLNPGPPHSKADAFPNQDSRATFLQHAPTPHLRASTLAEPDP